MQVMCRDPISSPLQAIIDTLWYCEGPVEHHTEVALPTGRAQLIVARTEPLLAQGVTIAAMTSSLGVDRRDLADRFRRSIGMG